MAGDRRVATGTTSDCATVAFFQQASGSLVASEQRHTQHQRKRERVMTTHKHESMGLRDII